MRRQRRPTPPTRPGALRVSLAAAVVVGLALAACTPVVSNGPEASPSAAPGRSESSAPTAVPGPSSKPSADASLATQTDTEWGRIWDAVPATFPRPPRSTAAEPIERTATSSDLSVDGDAEGIVEFYVTMLTPSDFVLSTQGPLEDGSWILDGHIPSSECQVQITVTPLGGLTHVTILYGAACPFG